jgi:methylated-DNA-protein-cysteine methyltransferase related protein
MSSLYASIYALVKLIPKGRVMSYGGVARQIGRPRNARAVGYALFALPAELHNKVPWWRVINSAGRISNSASPDAPLRQRDALRAEGVEVSDDFKIDLKRYDAETEVYYKLQKRRTP